MNLRIPILIITILVSAFCFAQKKTASVSGLIVDENENALASVSVSILGQQKGITTNDSGKFYLKLPADKAFALIFSYAGFKTVQHNFLLNEGE